MIKKVYIPVLSVLLSFQLVFSQNTKKIKVTPRFSVKVKVVDDATNKTIKNATVSVNGRIFPYSPVSDRYVIEARAGDELAVTHPDFENVYYTIKSDEDIKIQVKDFSETKRYRRGMNKKSRKLEKPALFKSETTSKSNKLKVDLYNTFLDSAKYFKEISIDKSLTFIQKILTVEESDNRNAATYRTLGNIYSFWKQYDLAIKNYITSLEYLEDISTKILMAKAQFLYKDFDGSEKTYISLLLIAADLRDFEKIEVYEGVGDVSLAMNEYQKAREFYNKALVIAEKSNIISKITDLNSKLGDVLAAEGKITQAKNRFANSLDLASQQDFSRSIQEKEKVADFFNKNNRFDDEIKLRKESLKAILSKDTLLLFDEYGKDFQSDIVENKKPDKTGIRSLEGNFEVPDSIQNSLSAGALITPQSINYKIGRAYTQKADYKNAIPFLKKSIDNPEGWKDNIEIKKDATRKLSETYAAVGEFDKALKSYQDYVTLVDQLYIEKSQEINRAKRFGQTLADNQNRIASLEKDKVLSDNLIKLAAKDQQLSEARNRSQLIIIYSLLAGILALFAVAYLLFRSNRQQKLANNLLALKSMRSQMNPHFIFNALNSVNSFIAVNDERNANRYLSEFSVLMRTVLENSDEDFIPLAKEIELLELYVKLEHNRFKDKFDYTIEVDKKIDLDQYSIPPMLLQPYIENAIWHGLRYKKEKGMLSIGIRKKDEETVLICIQDDGVGRKRSMEMKTKNQLKQKSKGMSTTRKRIDILNDMYQDRIAVTVSDVFKNGMGTKVELLLRKD